MKFIVSFTTSPTRIHKCQPMLKSIINQSRKPDLIILNIPKIFPRTGKQYSVPKDVSEHVVVNIIEKDFGPGTKLVPTIKYLNNNNYDKNNTRIIYLDDDIRYMNKMIECYEKNIECDDNSSWTATGFDFINFQLNGKRNNKDTCTIAEGYGAVCVKLSIFEDDFFEYINKYIDDIDCRLSDDIILSNYYHKKKINIKILNIPNEYSIIDMWKNKCILDYGNESDALHNGASGTSQNNVNRYKKVLFKLNNNKDRYFPVLFHHNMQLIFK